MNPNTLAQQLRGQWHGSQGMLTPLGSLPVYKIRHHRTLHTDSRCKQLPRKTGHTDLLVLDFATTSPGRLCTHCAGPLAELMAASRTHRSGDRYAVVRGDHQPWLRRGSVRASVTRDQTGAYYDDGEFQLVVLAEPVRCALFQHATGWVEVSGPSPSGADTPEVCELALGLWESPQLSVSELTSLATAFSAARSLLAAPSSAGLSG
jgi:hypothetical protein